MKTIFAILLLAFSVAAQGAMAEQDIAAVRSLLHRVMPKYASQIDVETIPAENGHDVFEVETIKGHLHLRGNSPVAISAGLNWYLNNVAHASVSWSDDQMSLPKTLLSVPRKVHIVTPFAYRYYLNYCTHSYSMAFWDWPRWEREIDWMALHGINMPLAITGSEAVWQNTLRRFNFSEDEIRRFIPGPGFTAWWLMGNLEGWGGPVSQTWVDNQVVLEQKILARMRELGMKPVLQGFYGMVPKGLAAKYPNARILDQGKWESFDRPSILMPNDPLFAEMARVYYAEQKKLYGDVQFLGGDPFHEGGKLDGVDLADAARHIQSIMLAGQPNAVWVLQGWQANPRYALLDGIDKNKSLILDLANEQVSQWQRRKGWRGFQWVFSIVNNFGGNSGLFGRLQTVSDRLAEVRRSNERGNLAGIGIMMEGIDNNPVVYDMLLGEAWQERPVSLDDRIRAYVLSRYGKKLPEVEKAWLILKDTVYKAPASRDSGNESFFCARPDLSLTHTSEWGSSEIYYNRTKVFDALGLMLDARRSIGNVGTYKHDLVDITRQSLADLGNHVYGDMIDAYRAKDEKRFDTLSTHYLELMRDQERLLATRPEYRVGTWIAQARSQGTTPAEQDLFERNARTQITTWSGEDSELHEYAFKEWSGLMSGLYIPRWEAFIEEMKASLRENREFRQPDFFQMEKAWATGHQHYSPKVEGDAVKTTLELYKKYSHY